MHPPKFPIVLPGGHLMPHMSKQRMRDVFDSVFETLGGEEKPVERFQLFLLQLRPCGAGVGHVASWRSRGVTACSPAE